MENFIFGIDLGTTNSSIALWNKNVIIIPDENGNKSIPSCVAYTNNNRYVGFEAKQQKDINIANMYYDIKRLLGKQYDDPIVQQNAKLLSYDITKNSNGNILLKSTLNDNKLINPEEISAAILFKLKSLAETYTKIEVKDVIITIPAYFTEAQRTATKNAATISGLNCLRMINEPTAAALAYGILDKNCQKTIIVYDFGGGTLDVSVVEINDGIYTVLGSAGNSQFGGQDFDIKIMMYCIDTFRQQINNKDFFPTSLNLHKLRNLCENAKITLSMAPTATISIPKFDNINDLLIIIDGELLESICNDLLLLCLKPIDDVCNEYSINADNIDDIILVGGMTKLPCIREIIKRKYHKINTSINPDDAIAIGAAIQGHILTNKNTDDKDAIILLDICHMSLGIEIENNKMDILIPKNTILPHKITKIYTSYDNSVMIKLFQGERIYTKDNTLLGEFELSGIKSNNCNPQIAVTISIDINGMITLDAKDMIMDNKISLIINNKNNFTNNDINILTENAKIYYLQDKKKDLYTKIYNICVNLLRYDNNNENIVNIKKEIDSGIEIDQMEHIYNKLKICYPDHAELEILYDNQENTIVKNELIKLCQDVRDILDNCKHIDKQLNDYIDDCLLWIYSGENLKTGDIYHRISILNEKCNTITFEIDIKKELKNLCLSLLIIEKIDNKLGDEILKYCDSEQDDDNITNNYLNILREIN